MEHIWANILKIWEELDTLSHAIVCIDLGSTRRRSLARGRQVPKSRCKSAFQEDMPQAHKDTNTRRYEDPRPPSYDD